MAGDVSLSGQRVKFPLIGFTKLMGRIARKQKTHTKQQVTKPVSIWKCLQGFTSHNYKVVSRTLQTDWWSPHWHWWPLYCSYHLVLGLYQLRVQAHWLGHMPQLSRVSGWWVRMCTMLVREDGVVRLHWALIHWLGWSQCWYANPVSTSLVADVIATAPPCRLLSISTHFIIIYLRIASIHHTLIIVYSN